MFRSIKSYFTTPSFWAEINLKKVYFILSVVFVFIAYFVPLLRFPKESSNPWPEAYEVIQQQIIEQQVAPPNTLPQYGEMGRSDMTYFLVRDLSMVNLRLVTGLPFETLERFLSVVVTLAILFAVYYFFTALLPQTVGFFAAILYMFLPRLANYYPNMNGEFFSFLLLFLSLYFSIRWIKSPSYVYLAFAAFFTGFLPVTFLVHLGIYGLILLGAFFSYLWQKQDKAENLKLFIKLFFACLAALILFSVVPLLSTGDISPGASSSIGSLHDRRPAEEIDYEQKYYKNYFTYGSTFFNFPPLLKEIYYLSSDASFFDYFEVVFLSLFIIGIIFAIKYWRERLAKFALITAVLFIALLAFFYSSYFNQNIYNVAQRILLYFSIPLVILSAFGFKKILQFSPKISIIFLTLFIMLSAPKSIYGAYINNSYPALYCDEYNNALSWLEANSKPQTIVLSNEETMGQFWLKAHQLDIVEGSKGSAVYFTYEEIYTLLDNGNKIFDPKIDSATTQDIIKKLGLKYIIIWNRPTAFEIMPYQIAKSKLDEMTFLNKVFEEQKEYDLSKTDFVRHGRFTAQATIYEVME